MDLDKTCIGRELTLQDGKMGIINSINDNDICKIIVNTGEIRQIPLQYIRDTNSPLGCLIQFYSVKSHI